MKDNVSNGKWFGVVFCWFFYPFFANFFVLLSTKHPNVEKKFQLPEKVFGICFGI